MDHGDGGMRRGRIGCGGMIKGGIGGGKIIKGELEREEWERKGVKRSSLF
jgi:hypothetical protein